MRRAALIALTMIACGSKTEPKPGPTGKADPPAPAPAPAKTDRFAKVKQPKVSAVCEKARQAFGYGAECIETELTALASPSGKVYRVVRKGDETASWTYVLVRPSGEMFFGDGGANGHMLDEITQGFDVRTQPPALLAQLYATLYQENAIVRCLPGAGDKLPPDRDGKPIACTPPAIEKKGDKQWVVAIYEEFPHPSLLNRDSHELSRTRATLEEHELSLDEGVGLAELPKDAPPPPDFPPMPTMTTPPAWVAKPVAAAADVSDALCKEASAKLSGLEGRQCKAYAYPSLDLASGSFYYLANDAGQRDVIAFRKTDGTIVVGFALDTDDPLQPIIAAYDPAVVPPAKMVALYLFMHGEPSTILCLPGSGDVIPGEECKPPAAEKKGDHLVISAILEEHPLPDFHGMVDDPAVRTFGWELGPEGGMTGGGFRLVDMREGTNE